MEHRFEGDSSLRRTRYNGIAAHHPSVNQTGAQEMLAPSTTSGSLRLEGSRVRSVFADSTTKADWKAIEYARSMTNADISDHSPEDLRIIDDLLDEYYREEVSRRNVVDRATVTFGCYLGEVFVRRLTGRWSFPTPIQALRVVLSWNRFAGERYLYILLGDEKVYVLRAAHKAIEKTGAVFSLYEFYQQYARSVTISPNRATSSP